MSEKVSAATVAETGKPGEVFVYHDGSTVKVVEVKGEGGVQRRAYQPSFPKGASPIGKELFLRRYDWKGFTKQPADEPTTKKEGAK